MKFLLFLLFLSQTTFSQFLGKVTYRVKYVYNVTINTDSSTKSYTLDTIKYSLPFDVLFTSKSVMIDGYGSFAVKTYERKGDESWSFHYYLLTNGNQVTIGQKVMYLVYPIVNRKWKAIIFDIDQETP